MEQPLAPTAPAYPKGAPHIPLRMFVSASVTYVLLHRLLDLGWFWTVVVAFLAMTVWSIHGTSKWEETPQYKAYQAARGQYEHQYEIYQRQMAEWRQQQYRAELQNRAMNDWIRLTGQRQRPPTWEWVVDRMAQIEQEDREAQWAEQQYQAQLAAQQVAEDEAWERRATAAAVIYSQQRAADKVVNELRAREWRANHGLDVY